MRREAAGYVEDPLNFQREFTLIFSYIFIYTLYILTRNIYEKGPKSVTSK